MPIKKHDVLKRFGMLHPIFAAPLSVLYGIVIDIRNRLFDLHILKSEEFDIPIVCVGNLTVGGTGKTPVTEFLIEHFSACYNVAVLSRGYKRKTKGFVLAEPDSSFRAVGDEPKQIKLKFPDVPVAVCEKRVEGIRRLRELHPEINLIILDDAFQHRYVEPWVSIVLMDYHNPIYKDHLMPWGTLRDSKRQLDRANFVLVTKCPEEMSPLDMRIVKKSLNLFPYQSLYFSRMQSGHAMPLFPDMTGGGALPAGADVVMMSGIANPKSLRTSLSKRFNVVSELVFEDHHTYRVRDMERAMELVLEAPAGTAVVITEKDAVKLLNRKKIPAEIQRRLYYVPIKVSFVEGTQSGFLRQLELYVRTNQKYSVLHPE